GSSTTIVSVIRVLCRREEELTTEAQGHGEEGNTSDLRSASLAPRRSAQCWISLCVSEPLWLILRRRLCAVSQQRTCRGPARQMRSRHDGSSQMKGAGAKAGPRCQAIRLVATTCSRTSPDASCPACGS